MYTKINNNKLKCGRYLVASITKCHTLHSIAQVHFLTTSIGYSYSVCVLCMVLVYHACLM